MSNVIYLKTPPPRFKSPDKSEMDCDFVDTFDETYHSLRSRLIQFLKSNRQGLKENQVGHEASMILDTLVATKRIRKSVKCGMITFRI